MKRITAMVYLSIVLITLSPYSANAADRVVLKSITPGLWYKNIYLIADKITWMDYENFTVQIGDRGEIINNFPNWYHGKYEPSLYAEDISGDSLKEPFIHTNSSNINTKIIPLRVDL